jgi:hypothetical protein
MTHVALKKNAGAHGISQDFVRELLDVLFRQLSVPRSQWVIPILLHTIENPGTLNRSAGVGSLGGCRQLFWNPVHSESSWQVG